MIKMQCFKSQGKGIPGRGSRDRRILKLEGHWYLDSQRVQGVYSIVRKRENGTS